jgi:E3 ubiquitin-protein ligase SHPRH
MKTTEWKGAYSVRKKGLSSVGHRPVRSLIDLRRVLSSLEGPRGEAPPVAYESVDVNMHPVQVPQEAVPIIRGSRKGNPKTSETRETTSIRDIPDLADQKKVPVWSHDITIQLNTQAPSVNDFVTPDQASALGWAEEEQLLVESLALRSTSDQIEDFPLGDPVYIYLMDQRNAVFLKPLATRFASGAKRFISWENMDYVLNIPEFVDPSFDLPSHDFTHEHGYGDIIRAAVALQETDRATLEGKLTIQLLPEGGGHYNPRHELPLRLRLQLTLSLHNPAIFYPVSALTPNLAEAQRRVLYHVFGSPDQLHTDHAHTTIPFFYSILNPAPPLPLHLHTDAVQPRQLKARLLPFQKRSVHWLLEREGMSIDSSGTLIPRPPNEESDLPLFWKRVPSPLHSGRAGKSSSATDWYFNPVSGNVVSSIPPHEESPGGMLSDEMGLGKTVRIIP